MIISSRRGFIAGLASLVCAAPAIVRIDSIMKVKPVIIPVTALDALTAEKRDFLNVAAPHEIAERLMLSDEKVQAYRAKYQGMNTIAYWDENAGHIVVKEVDIVENELLARAVSRDVELRMRLGGGQTVEEMGLLKQSIAEGYGFRPNDPNYYDVADRNTSGLKS